MTALGWVRVFEEPEQPPARVYPADAAAMVLGPRVTCAATGEQRPNLDACYSTCNATCGTSPEWTERDR